MGRGEGKGVEGNEAKRPWGQVMKSFVGLFKNQNLTLGSESSLRDWS